MTLGRRLKYLRQCWPWPANRSAVIAGYRALALEYPQTLADIGVRNHVFAPLPDDGDALALARAAGRQECALEIMGLANVDAAQVQRLLESKPTETGR